MNQGFITVSINFRYDAGSFAADLALNDTGAVTAEKALPLPGPIGEGSLTLGAAPESAGPGEPLALQDELLIAYSAEPL
jgi:hypothetical protein